LKLLRIYQIGFTANLFRITIDQISVGVVIHVPIDVVFVRANVSWYIARNLIEADAADDMRRVCMYVRVCI
jgi:hypothetical protein